MIPTDAMSWLMWTMVAGLLVLLWASALLLSRLVLPGRPRRPRDENEAIGELSLRLARGEISVDEFEQRRQLVLDAFRH
ncbi:SHOCT domain-containing protein [Brachybacterium sp. P6-10-X1]|uniref:SHOCT domain-containing protein n=1 Tax=Brachybacterium sp. P6-10-X1 TaxID=1903186 RepID=UPI000975E1B2|nr:SHOCT domain-containing protein [Brachybacterium sp. P6-10-X1]